MSSSKAGTTAEPLAAGGFAWVRQHLFEVVPVEVIERDLRKPIPELAEIPGMEIHRVTSAQPGRWQDLVPRTQRRTVQRFLARGDVGYLASIEDNFAGRIWVSHTSHRDPWSGLRIRLAPDEAYAYAMEVIPRYRALGLATPLVGRMLSDLREDKRLARVYGWVDSRNRESLFLLRIVFGFTQVQTAKRAHLLRRIGWQVRGSDQPSFGPLSRTGRHSEARRDAGMATRSTRGSLGVEEVLAPAQLAEAWDSLADRLEVAPFLRPGWIFAWSQAFARGHLSLLTARRDGELVGVLPFVRRGGVVSAPANWHTPVFGYLAVDQDVTAALAERFVSSAPVRADLSFLDHCDPGVDACRGAAAHTGQRVVVRTILQSPYVEMAGGDWASYRSSLRRKTRKEVERQWRRLEEQGNVSFDVADGRSDLERLVEEGFRLEGSGWKEKQGSAIVSRPHTYRFYRDIVRWAAERGWLALAFLRLDGRAIAFDLCLQANGVVYVMKGGFDTRYRRFGPGMLLTHELLRRGFEQRLLSCEFLGEADPYKLVWTDTTRDRVRFQAFARSLRGQIDHFAWSRGRPTALRTWQFAERFLPAVEGVRRARIAARADGRGSSPPRRLPNSDSFRST
jgi:CelD/BcsL family acetyltransferase involved in cellulose biosynthesis